MYVDKFTEKAKQIYPANYQKQGNYKNYFRAHIYYY